MSQFNRAKPGNRNVIGLLDIGSSKIVCLVVALDARAAVDPRAAVPDPSGQEQDSAENAMRVVGVAHHRSQGIKAGVIVDLDRAEEAVRACVSQAERMAGVTLDEVVVSINCGRLKSTNFAAHADLAQGVVRDGDVTRIVDDARVFIERDGRSLVHMNRVGFRLDGASGGRDPRGMAARRLTADLHAVSADEAQVRNLLMLIDRCYLNVAGLVVAPYASGLSVLSAEERRLGVTCIDIGGGTTSFGVFNDESLIYADGLAVGSDHITFDIARKLQTPLAEAERIKALYGTLVYARSDEQEVFSYPLAGEEDGAAGQATKAQLTQIIAPRVSSILALFKERFERSGLRDCAGERFVITGGGSQLVGLGEFAAKTLGAPVRIGRPSGVSGLPHNVSSPAFSTVVGMLSASVDVGGEQITRKDRDQLSRGYIGRVGQWLMESL